MEEALAVNLDYRMAVEDGQIKFVIEDFEISSYEITKNPYKMKVDKEWQKKMYRDAGDTIMMGARYTLNDLYSQVFLESLGELSGIMDGLEIVRGADSSRFQLSI